MTHQQGPGLASLPTLLWAELEQRLQGALLSQITSQNRDPNDAQRAPHSTSGWGYRGQKASMGSVQLLPLGSHHELHWLLTSAQMLRHLENLSHKELGTFKSGTQKQHSLFVWVIAFHVLQNVIWHLSCNFLKMPKKDPLNINAVPRWTSGLILTEQIKSGMSLCLI